MSNDQVASGLVEPQGLGEEPLYYFTRVFLLFLQGLFQQFPAGSYKWSFDEKTTDIVITDQVPIPRTRVEQKPQIVTMRGPARFAALSLDQMLTVDPKTGEKVRTDLVSCTMTINCIAKSGVEAQRIAWIVATQIRNFKETLQRYGMHKVGDQLEIGPESPPNSFFQEADPEWVVMSVFCPFHFQWTASVKALNAPLLRDIEANLKSALLPQAATTTAGSVEARTVLSTPTIRGRAINQVQVTELDVGAITQKVKT